uniref:DM2 domain-containing protein n=1 Tax=viral metagenome TaxID=1070528 RepID=A0A6C0HHK7_9ZZZZ
MVRQTKQTATPAVSTPAPVVENVVIEAKATKVAKKAVKEPKAAAPAPAVVATPAPAVVAEPVVAEPATEVAENATSLKLAEFGAKIQQATNVLSTLKSDFKTLEKAIVRDLKAAQKSSGRKRKSTNANRQPSGFAKPTRISDELAKFLGKPVGTELARTGVSKEINTYIRTHNLQDKTNGRLIHPDTKLASLLNIKNGEELTYFNLQRYMKHHFVKETVSTA